MGFYRVLGFLKAYELFLSETINILRKPPPPQKKNGGGGRKEFYHKFMYKAPSNDRSFADHQSAFESVSKRIEVVFRCLE